MSNEKKVFHDYLQKAFGENVNNGDDTFDFVVDLSSPTKSISHLSYKRGRTLSNNPTEDEIKALCRDIVSQPGEELIEGSQMFITKKNIQWNLLNNFITTHISLIQSTKYSSEALQEDLEERMKERTIIQKFHEQCTQLDQKKNTLLSKIALDKLEDNIAIKLNNYLYICERGKERDAIKNYRIARGVLVLPPESVTYITNSPVNVPLSTLPDDTSSTSSDDASSTSSVGDLFLPLDTDTDLDDNFTSNNPNSIVDETAVSEKDLQNLNEEINSYNNDINKIGNIMSRDLLTRKKRNSSTTKKDKQQTQTSKNRASSGLNAGTTDKNTNATGKGLFSLFPKENTNAKGRGVFSFLSKRDTPTTQQTTTTTSSNQTNIQYIDDPQTKEQLNAAINRLNDEIKQAEEKVKKYTSEAKKLGDTKKKLSNNLSTPYREGEIQRMRKEAVRKLGMKKMSEETIRLKKKKKIQYLLKRNELIRKALTIVKNQDEQ